MAPGTVTHDHFRHPVPGPPRTRDPGVTNGPPTPPETTIAATPIAAWASRCHRWSPHDARNDNLRHPDRRRGIEVSQMVPGTATHDHFRHPVPGPLAPATRVSQMVPPRRPKRPFAPLRSRPGHRACHRWSPRAARSDHLRHPDRRRGIQVSQMVPGTATHDHFCHPVPGPLAPATRVSQMVAPRRPKRPFAPPRPQQGHRSVTGDPRRPQATTPSGRLAWRRRIEVSQMVATHVTERPPHPNTPAAPEPKPGRRWRSQRRCSQRRRTPRQRSTRNPESPVEVSTVLLPPYCATTTCTPRFCFGSGKAT
ncbi:hypothetical protein FBY40_0345 [Microbacterium sp. SLBN-154]|nr:hypothetical protein FBY40_0345 [Microbacterium sp. SLBN-154]